ncbi:centrosomal protein of 44 kDa isoform X2 [Thalassophryne amazonica]|uniref:centrosomal protein of 44 kDa isoform X2 n=1 Tax=Thalassophryne amazonica TaxID=390379 RepID=UPI00147103A4|nr:centrosomal protein of 44 kDa isoform X2 [Thalassophryne amazonica]
MKKRHIALFTFFQCLSQFVQFNMLSTGDVQGSLRKLESLLRVIKYPGLVDYNGLCKGNPSAFLPILSFTITSYSPPFAEQLVAAELELTGKNDLRFTETLYKILRDMFHYKPILSKQQFLQWGFSQRKISVVCDVINLVMQRHNQLKKPRVKYPASHTDVGVEVYPIPATPNNILENRPYVIKHIGNHSTFLTSSSHKETAAFSHNEAASSNSPDSGTSELAAEEEDMVNVPNERTDALPDAGFAVCQLSEVEERLSALEIKLERLVSGLDWISVLENRLQELEKWKNTKEKSDKDEGSTITISKESWENLLSRVLLLETKVELSNSQSSVPQPSMSHTPSQCPSSTSRCLQDDLKDRLQRITDMMKSTSTLLKNTESSTTPCS